MKHTDLAEMILAIAGDHETYVVNKHVKINSLTPEVMMKEVVYWFVAYQQAEGFQDLRQKDMAHFFLDGVPPMSPQQIDSWLDTMHDMVLDELIGEGDEEPLLEQIEGKLREKIKEIVCQFYGEEKEED